MAKEIGLFEAMYTLRAIRRLKPDPVSDELINKLIEAATKAPSGGDRQPWAFIVIRDPATRQKIGEWYLDAWNQTYGVVPQEARERLPANLTRVLRSAEHLAHHLAEAPVLILACASAPGGPPGSPPGVAAASHYGSIFPAVQNLLLAARGLGLGATLTTLHRLHEQDVKDLLGIPANVEAVALIPVGHPIGTYGPTKRRPVDEVIHHERWDSSKA
jgi:nitroreductase